MDTCESTEESKEIIYDQAKHLHETLERRLRMLLKKAYRTDSEETELKTLKKKKLYYKDIMESISSTPQKKENH